MLVLNGLCLTMAGLADAAMTRLALEVGGSPKTFILMALLHSGDFVRLDTPSHVNAVGVVSPDKTRAVFSWANLTGHRETFPGRLYFTELDPKKKCRIQIIWPSPIPSHTSPSNVEAAELGTKGTVLPGEALMQMGLQVPLMNPETCLIYALKAE